MRQEVCPLCGVAVPVGQMFSHRYSYHQEGSTTGEGEVEEDDIELDGEGEVEDEESLSGSERDDVVDEEVYDLDELHGEGEQWDLD